MKITVPAVALTASLLLSTSAMAVSTFNLYDDWNPGACTQDGPNTGTYGNRYTCSEQNTSAKELKVNAYSAPASGGAYAAAYIGDYGTSGFGVKSTADGLGANSPHHAIDNNNGIDGLLLSFNSSIALNSLTIGWKGGLKSSSDDDFSLYAWTGSTGNAIADLTSSTATQLAGSWTLIGSYADTSVNSARNINGGGISSSYWLVSAYNAVTGGAIKVGSSSAFSAGNDYFKLASVSGTFTCLNSNSPACNSTSVPEPASLAMVTVGLLGIVGARRRRVTKRA